MPSWSSLFDPSSHSRLDTVTVADGMNRSEGGNSSPSGGVTGVLHEDTSASAITFSTNTQGNRHTTTQDTPAPSRTVRKKKSSYDLRDEFRHPEAVANSAPEPVHDAGVRGGYSPSVVVQDRVSGKRRPSRTK
jgi:hypothetical protein